MNTKHLKTWLLVFCLFGALFPFASVAKALKTDPISREQTFKETCKLLDLLEEKYPREQIQFVRIRERIQKLYNTPKIVSVEAARAMANNPRGLSADWAEFYESIKDKTNEELFYRLQTKIKHQKALNYSDSRRHIIMRVDNVGKTTECVYTGRLVPSDKMPNHTNMNIEHSWPQSHGATGVAKADLHHLFPTDSKANSTRGSLYFGWVTNPNWQEGGSKCDGSNFEVRKKYRGNIARAQFYFAVRYNKKIKNTVEKVLREWHKEDPIDAKEVARNSKIEAIQDNRNPFIDHPEFVNKIADF